MSELVIERVDPFDETGFDRWYDLVGAAWRHDRGPDGDPVTREELRQQLQQDTGRVEERIWLGSVGGEAVGAAWLSLPLKDNHRLAFTRVQVLPEHRRRGFGTQLLDFVEGEAAGAGREIFAGEVWWPWSRGSAGSGAPGPGFAAARGYALSLVEVRRRLSLPVAGPVLDRLAAEASSRHGGYTLRNWAGPVPDELAEGWERLAASLEDEAPTGDLTIEAPEPDVAHLRESEALMEKQGRTSFGAVAIAPDGDVVAYTQLAVSGDDGKAYQWGTLVRSDHRGHRLGTAVKVANLRLLQEMRPDVPSISTYNAEVNSHMIAVNEALGFEAVEWLGSFQKTTP